MKSKLKKEKKKTKKKKMKIKKKEKLGNNGIPIHIETRIAMRNSVKTADTPAKMKENGEAVLSKKKLSVKKKKMPMKKKKAKKIVVYKKKKKAKKKIIMQTKSEAQIRPPEKKSKIVSKKVVRVVKKKKRVKKHDWHAWNGYKPDYYDLCEHVRLAFLEGMQMVCERKNCEACLHVMGERRISKQFENEIHKHKEKLRHDNRLDHEQVFVSTVSPSKQRTHLSLNQTIGPFSVRKMLFHTM